MEEGVRMLIKRYVEEVCDGRSYKGYIKIGDTTLDYELEFSVSIPDFRRTKPTRIEELRRVLQISVTKDGATIELEEEEEYGLFAQLLTNFVMDLHANPQLSDKCRAQFPDLLPPMTRTDEGWWKLYAEHADILTGPKFGCTLTS